MTTFKERYSPKQKERKSTETMLMERWLATLPHVLKNLAKDGINRHSPNYNEIVQEQYKQWRIRQPEQ